TAVSPIFLVQLVQPMSDVPAAAWWLLTVVLIVGRPNGRAQAFGSGFAASMGVLTRPNLLPLALVAAGYLAWAPAVDERLAGDAPRYRRRAILGFVAGLAPGLIVLGLLQRSMYGSPFATGYGSLGGMFSLAHVAPNLQRYPRWLVDTQTPLIVLALVAPWLA